MKILISTLFISLIISTLSTPPIIEEREKIIEEYYLNTPLLQNTLQSKTLELINPIFKIKLLLDGEENEYSFTLKAYNLPSGVFYNTYSITFGKIGVYSLKKVSFKKKNGKCNLDNKQITCNFELYNEEEIDIILNYKIYNPNLFELYRLESISLPSRIETEGLIQVTCKNPVSCIGTKNGIFKKKGKNLYEYKGIISEKNIFDFIQVGYGSAKWKAKIEGYLFKKSIFDKNNVFFETSRFFLGANNKIKSYEVSSNVAKKIDGIKISDKHFKFLFQNYPLNEKTLFFKFEAEFSNIVKSNWNFYFNKKYHPKMYNGVLIIKKAKEILSNDNSNEPKHIKIGRWVFKNVKYDIKYAGKKMTPEEILTKLTGVCSHFTILYNALLNSIGIQTVYISGYGFNSKKSLSEDPDNSSHAWTIAFIDNKWVPLDATWGIFEGQIPTSHVFEAFIVSRVTYYKCDGCTFKRYNQLIFYGYDDVNDELK